MTSFNSLKLEKLSVLTENIERNKDEILVKNVFSGNGKSYDLLITGNQIVEILQKNELNNISEEILEISKIFQAIFKDIYEGTKQLEPITLRGKEGFITVAVEGKETQGSQPKTFEVFALDEETSLRQPIQGELQKITQKTFNNYAEIMNFLNEKFKGLTAQTSSTSKGKPSQEREFSIEGEKITISEEYLQVEVIRKADFLPILLNHYGAKSCPYDSVFQAFMRNFYKLKEGLQGFFEVLKDRKEENLEDSKNYQRLKNLYEFLHEFIDTNTDEKTIFYPTYVQEYIAKQALRNKNEEIIHEDAGEFLEFLLEEIRIDLCKVMKDYGSEEEKAGIANTEIEDYVYKENHGGLFGRQGQKYYPELLADAFPAPSGVSSDQSLILHLSIPKSNAQENAPVKMKDLRNFDGRSFNEIGDLLPSQFIIGVARSVDGKNKVTTSIDDIFEIEIGKDIYQLTSLVEHTNPHSTESGHFVAYFRDNENEWYKLDDLNKRKCSKVDENTVQKASEGLYLAQYEKS